LLVVDGLLGEASFVTAPTTVVLVLVLGTVVVVLVEVVVVEVVVVAVLTTVSVFETVASSRSKYPGASA
jgi:hypothetical protein